jgi:hypothetical protein
MRFLTEPYLPPSNVDISSNTNTSSIAFYWSGMSYDMKGSGGLNCDFKIWYYNDTATKKILLVNSTQGKLMY